MAVTPEQATEFQTEIRERSDGAYNDILTLERNGIQMFLRKLGYPDPEDEKMISYLRYVRDNQALMPNARGTGLQQVPGTMVYTPDGFMEWAKRKLDLTYLVQFFSWLLSQIDLSNAVSAAYWNDKYPWLVKLREQQVEITAERQKKMAKIAIKGGPSTEEDFKFLWMVAQGKIAVPKDAPHVLFAPDDSERYAAATFIDNFMKNEQRTVYTFNSGVNRQIFQNDPTRALREMFAERGGTTKTLGLKGFNAKLPRGKIDQVLQQSLG